MDKWRFAAAPPGQAAPKQALPQARKLRLQRVADLARQSGGRLEIGPGPAAAFSLCFASPATALVATAP